MISTSLLYALVTASVCGQSYTNRLPCFHSLPGFTETKQSGAFIEYLALLLFFFRSLFRHGLLTIFFN